MIYQFNQMIKIEFKEAQYYPNSQGLHSDRVFDVQDDNTPMIVFSLWKDHIELVKSVSFGCPSELVPSRSEILKQLGITEEEDELFQQQYKNV